MPKTPRPGLIATIVLALILGFCGGLPVVSAPATAAPPRSEPNTVAVDHFDDTFDLSDGGCTSHNGYAHCGLREAIQVANSAPGHWTVLLAAGAYTLTRPISTDLYANDGRDLKVTGDVVIAGQGPDQTAIVAGYDLGVRARVLSFYAPATAVLSGTAISGGRAPDAANENGYGDAAWPGGGIFNQGVLTVTHCLIQDNRAGDGAVVDFSHPNGSPGGDGGGIYNTAQGGSPGRLTLIESRVISNAAGHGGKGGDMQGSPLTLGKGGPGGNGGGVANNGGAVLIQDSAIISNTAGTGGFAGELGGGNRASANKGGDGGGVHSMGPGVLTIVRSTFSANHAGRGGDAGPTVTGNGGDGGDGGGLYSASPLVVISSTLRDNYAGFGGDALYQGVGGHGSDGGGFEAYGDVAVHVEACTIAGNHSGDGGRGAGGLKSGGGGDAGGIDFEAASMTIENSTLSDNHTGAAGPGNSEDGDGGGLSVQPNALCRIDHSTIAGNDARRGQGGGLTTHGSTVLMNTIVAGNSAEGAGPDLFGAVQSGDHNLIQDDTDATISGTGPGDLYAVDPRLAPLADNGGPSPTRALLPGSPAIDAGSCGDITGAGLLTVDERGVVRPQGQGCDIGAYEATAAGR